MNILDYDFYVSDWEKETEEEHLVLKNQEKAAQKRKQNSSIKSKKQNFSFEYEYSQAAELK